MRGKKWTRRLTALGICVAVLALATPAVQAGSLMDYGDLMANTVWFRDIVEDSGTDATPLYGVPNVTGNSLDFDPVSFNAFASGAADSDITDGTLSMRIEAKQGFAINKLLYKEAGDFTLLGLGTDNTLASVSSSFFIDILSVDGVGINPINLILNMQVDPSNGVYRLVEQGGGPLQSGDWTGSLMIDLAQALSDAGQPYQLGATRVSVTLDNTLGAASEDGTSAFIAKKDFGGTSITVVPEPSSWVLAGLALLGLRWLVGRRRA